MLQVICSRPDTVSARPKVDLILFQLGAKTISRLPSVESYFLYFSKPSYAPIESRSHSPIQQNKPISLTRQNSPFEKKETRFFIFQVSAPTSCNMGKGENNSKLGRSGSKKEVSCRGGLHQSVKLWRLAIHSSLLSISYF